MDLNRLLGRFPEISKDPDLSREDKIELAKALGEARNAFMVTLARRLDIRLGGLKVVELSQKLNNTETLAVEMYKIKLRKERDEESV